MALALDSLSARLAEKRTPAARRAHGTVHDLFEEVAAAVPEATAVVAGGREMTYRELDRRATRLAHHLLERGIGPQQPVGVLQHRSERMIVSLLAILKAGGIYVPLDPSYPDSRLRFLLEDAEVAAVVTEPGLGDRVAGLVPAVVAQEPPAECSDAHGPVLPGEVDPEATCYVMYTSGSTGTPKGVAVPHRGVVRLVRRPGYVELGPDEVILQLASVAFDASTFEIWGALLNGGRLVLPPSGPVSIAVLRRAIREHGVTTLWLTAGLFHQVMAEEPEAVRGVRQLLAGGDVLSVPHVRTALETLPTCRLVNGYGPTENTTFTCCHPVAAEDLEGSVPIGRPITGTTVHVVDASLEPVAEGEVGELVTGGAGLAHGYLGRPGLTAESFVPDPFSETPGARLYRTGDLVRRRADGSLEFVGRTDDQVKIRGFRVELGEVESVLAEHPEVRLAAAVARPDASGDKRLDAYVTPAEESELAPGALLAFLRRRLPTWMVPQSVTMLAELPLTLNGKVDRRALPEPDGYRPRLSGEPTAPRSATERSVAAIFSDLLEVGPIGVSDDLFELGGHSLTAIRVATRIRAEFGVEIPIAELFAEPTVEHLAARVDAARQRPGAGRSLALTPARRDEPLPLSAAQRRVWFLSRLEPESLAYSFQSTYHLRGELRIDALEQALTEIVRRHEILRTTFPAEGGEPVQRIHAPFEVSLDPIDLSAGGGNVEVRLAAAIDQEVARSFDLEVLPLVRWSLFALGEREHVLLQVEHHLVHDGWSFNVFLGELAALYRAFVAGEPSPLPPLEVQFADYAAYERRWCETPEARRQLTYWEKRLAGAEPALDLPYDRPRPRRATHRGAVRRIELPAPLCNSLRTLARRHRASLFMVLFATFATLLHRYSRQTDLSIGCGVANRHLPETEQLIGMIINTIVLRPDLSGDPAFVELLGRVRRLTREAYAHQQLPFDRVVEALQPKRNLAENPLFQAAFSFHDAPLTDVTLPGLDTEVTVGLSNGSAKFDLNVVAIPLKEQRTGEGGTGRDSVEMIWEYSTDLFDGTTIDRMLAHYRQLLEAIVANPERPLSTLPLMAPDEEHRVVHGWNRTAAAYPDGATIPGLLARRAAERPEAPAVLHSDGVLTYGELDAAAGRLARRLCARGAGPEAPVAFLLERSPEAIITELAVLKAGSFYVPLDPDFPLERLRFMLEDSGASLLVVDGDVPAGLTALVDELGVEPLPLAVEAGADEPAPRAVPGHPDGLAYVMYTSGSTGRPKGVAVTHRNVISLVAGAGYLPFGRDEVYLAAAPLSFDASTFEIWAPLLTGARLAVPPPGRLSLSELGSEIRRHGVTTLWLTAGLFDQMVEERLADLEPLDHLLAGGDVLDPGQVNRVVRELPATAMINGYGPTETTTFATCHRVPASGVAGPVPIGRPLANHHTYVVDHHLRPVPVGVPGELLVGGAGVARGYLGRPGLTADRFIPDHLSERPGARLYRTGDLVRRRPDGSLDFLGRIDQQIKLRGFRVEPGEIESVLRQHPAVTGAVVVVRGKASGDRRLIGYLTPATVDLGEIRAHLEQRLPEHMIPTALVPMESFPLGPTGKVDRNRLPDPGGAAAGATPYVAPRTELEEILAAVWSELTGAERVGLRDNFFELGGHSLHATRHMVRLEELLGISLPLSMLYDAADLEALANAVETTLVRELEALSEEEAARMISEASGEML